MINSIKFYLSNAININNEKILQITKTIKSETNVNLFIFFNKNPLKLNYNSDNESINNSDNELINESDSDYDNESDSDYDNESNSDYDNESNSDYDNESDNNSDSGSDSGSDNEVDLLFKNIIKKIKNKKMKNKKIKKISENKKIKGNNDGLTYQYDIDELIHAIR